MTQSEKMAKIREEVRNTLGLPEDAVRIDTDTYVIKTETGKGKVTISAIKDPDFDEVEAHEEYLFEREEARKAAEARHAEAEAKKQANLKRKAENKAKKEA